MRRIAFLLIIFFIVGCGNQTSNNNRYETIPQKIDLNGTNIEASSINTQNIDDYLFREDVVYVDLRHYSWVVKDGHIAGFSFYPFYELIATKEGTTNDGVPTDNRLFKMKNESGMLGEIGNFVPNYVESELVLNELFPKDKYIFAISQSGQESRYLLNLLIQYNYDASKLYNIGGFSIGTGYENKPYIGIENPRYLVKGNPLIDTTLQNVTFDFMRELTPINDN